MLSSEQHPEPRLLLARGLILGLREQAERLLAMTPGDPYAVLGAIAASRSTLQLLESFMCSELDEDDDEGQSAADGGSRELPGGKRPGSGGYV